MVFVKVMMLTRIYQGDDCCIGKLFDNITGWDTIERPWLNNAKGISCIPEGIYTCSYHNTPTKPDCWEVLNVPNRTAILIHTANCAHELEGCIAIGTSHGRLGEDRAVFHSKDAMNELRDYIGRDSEGRLNSFQLQISSEA